MADTRVVLNIEGFNALRRSPEVMADLERRARAIASAATANAGAGAEFEVETITSATRGRVRVATANRKAQRAEALDAALTRAIDAGRG